MESLVSKLCSFMGMFALVQTFLPATLRQWLDQGLEMLWEKLFHTPDPHMLLEVEERTSNHYYNVFYRHSAVYLSSLHSAMDAQVRLKVFRSHKGSSLSFSLPDKETLEDSFQGARIWWTHSCRSEKEGGGSSEDKRSFSLQFLKAERSIIMPSYLNHVSKLAIEIEHRNAHRHLYTNNFRCWEEIPFNHPSTFDTLALQADLANRLKVDLDTFSKGEEFYHKNGRAWKRGYLLYGPPGTGKSSLIAAIANYLHFDIFDLELTKVLDNAELKSLLMQTSRKSIIVIEDIDCSVQFLARVAEQKSSDKELITHELKESSSAPYSGLTLSGLLNFTDGLWSCCGEERVFIFTTNHKDRLDPALLRPGRMDMHILLSYCTFEAFKKMAFNYLGIHDHELYREVEKMMAQIPHEITPAAVAELLIGNQSNADAALKQVMAIFEGKSIEKEVILGNEKEQIKENEKADAGMPGLKKKGRRGEALFILGNNKMKHKE